MATERTSAWSSTAALQGTTWQHFVVRLDLPGDGPHSRVAAGAAEVDAVVTMDSETELIAKAARSSAADLSDAERKALGQWLLPEEHGAAFAQWLRRTAAAPRRLVLEFAGQATGLETVPWEAAIVANRELWDYNDLSIVRRVAGVALSPALTPRRAPETFVLQSDIEIPLHSLDTESHPTRGFLADIDQHVQVGSRSTALLHLTAHGAEDELKFDSKGTKWMSADRVRGILHRQFPELQVIVIAACGGTGQAERAHVPTATTFSEIAPAVISFREPISKDQAERFCAELYATLSAGDSVDSAVARARRSLYESDRSSAALPQLQLRVLGDTRLWTPAGDSPSGPVDTNTPDRDDSPNPDVPCRISVGDRSALLWSRRGKVVQQSISTGRFDDAEWDFEEGGSFAVSVVGRVAASVSNDTITVVTCRSTTSGLAISAYPWAADLPLPDELRGRDARVTTVSLQDGPHLRLYISTKDGTWLAFLGPRGWSNCRRILEEEVISGFDAPQGTVLVTRDGRDVSVAEQDLPDLTATLPRLAGVDFAHVGGVSYALAWGWRRGARQVRAAQQVQGTPWQSIPLGDILENRAGFRQHDVMAVRIERMPPTPRAEHDSAPLDHVRILMAVHNAGLAEIELPLGDRLATGSTAGGGIL